jgi:hypothetical protein
MFKEHPYKIVSPLYSILAEWPLPIQSFKKVLIKKGMKNAEFQAAFESIEKVF